MKGTLADLKEDILKVQELLESDLFSVSKEDGTRILSDSRNLMEKIDTIEGSFLTIGLLGGTGVGKSTLMNVLAGKAIASASHLRPHTDDILIYRHADTPVPSSLPISGIPWREFTHGEATIKRILLCDLPDFDSLVRMHRERVIQFLEYLDLLIWVTSPEKYGDARFYEFLRLVPRSKDNFYFVLNKTDLLFDGKSGNDGLDEVAVVTKRLREYLKGEGLMEPPLYVVSSGETLEGKSLSHWNQFPNLRQEVFRQRKFKEIKEIKGANLESDYELLLMSFNRELSYLESLRNALKVSLSTWGKVVEDSIYNIEKDIDRYFERNQDDFVRRRLDDLSSLVGPSYGFAAFMKEWQKFTGRQSDYKDRRSKALHIAEIFEKHSGWREDIIAEHLLRQGYQKTVVDRIKGIVEKSTPRSNYQEKLAGILENPPARESLFSRLSFKSIQYGTYMVLFFVLLFSLSGEELWRELIATPGLKSILNFVLKIVSILFSPTGLAALGSYLLLNIFVGYRFYRAFLRRREKEGRKSREVVLKEIMRIWKRKLEETRDALEDYEREIVSRVSSILGLKHGN